MGVDKKNRILTLKQDAEVMSGLPLKKGFQLEVIQGVVYAQGQMLQSNLQQIFLNWINNNPNLFDATLNY